MAYKIIMLILLSCFYYIYFAKQISLKKQGIHTNRLAKGSKPTKTRIIELCLLLITYTMAAVQFLSVFFYHYAARIEFPEYIPLIGIGLTLLGVVIFLLSVITMGRNWRAGIDESQKTEIISAGIYKYSRNPAFVGFDLLYIGSALVFPSTPIAMLTLAAVITLHLQILEEEKYLSKKFGEAYESYKNKTTRYLI